MEFTTRTSEFAAEASQRVRRVWPRLWPPLLTVAGVVTVFWKLVLTKQYTFLGTPDLANQVMPWLGAQVHAIRHWSILLWSPYEWFGQSLIGQVQPGVTSPFTFLLALAPLHNGQIQVFYVQLWYVLIHCAAGLFAYWLFADLGCAAGPAVLGAIFYSTGGFCGNTEWPQQLAPAIWAPLVFLFLLRSLRGRAPLRNAAWAGAALGVSWLCGHHAPSLALTYAVAGVGAVALFRRGARAQAALRLGVLFGVMALVAAVQALPAAEYGKLAKRWTATGALTWKDKVEYPEHQDSGLRPTDLLHLVMPGGSGLRSDPFTGTVALSLAGLAVWSSFRRREVKMFLLLALAALLYALSRYDPLYGILYALGPMIEKSRAPIVSLSIFHFAVASLTALGANALVSGGATQCRAIAKVLLWFGAVTFGIFTLVTYLQPTVTSVIVEGDPRPGMIGLVALLAAALYHAWFRGLLRRQWLLVFAALLLIIEQGNEVGWAWAHVRDVNHRALLNALYDTRDLAVYLRSVPGEKRLEINDKDVPFSFGDWYQIPAAHAMTASMLTATSELGGWWDDRLVRMYGMNYAVSRAPTRGSQQERFTGKSGIKIWHMADTFPRAWTVHQTVVAPNDSAGRDMVRSPDLDLRKTAVMAKTQPSLAQCGGEDRVTGFYENPSQVWVNVEMACQGLLIVSDNWYPGWRAEVDGRAAEIWKVNTVIRGVVVNAGKHTVAMRYRPLSVYFGFAFTLVGLTAAIVLHRRRETDGADTLGDAPKED
ncbi:MAG TPA: YfhO family protein [Bryobacteraceae bacterium]